MKIKAYAKINLLLDILGKTDEEYHDLFMIMQSVSLFDEIEINKNNDDKIKISCSNEEIPTDERNIAHKAAVAFFEYTEIPSTGISIHINKNIPHTAGLAGGSADGAGVIAGLNRLFKTNLNDRQLIEIAAKVGSDVPFCITGGTMCARGRGTELTYLPQLKFENIIIIKPPCSVSTKEAYDSFDTAENITHPFNDAMLNACRKSERKQVLKNVANIFEQFIHIPQRVEIKSIMRRYDAKCACMSGSGPSVFGIFENKENAELCLKEIAKKYPESFLVSTTDCGTEII